MRVFIMCGRFGNDKVTNAEFIRHAVHRHDTTRLCKLTLVSQPSCAVHQSCDEKCSTAESRVGKIPAQSIFLSENFHVSTAVTLMQ